MNENVIIGTWKSISEIEVLDYNSNFSNWIGESPIPGYYMFSFFLDSTETIYIAKLDIPITLGEGKGHYTIYKGRFEIDKKEIRIWQNEKVPVRIPYKLRKEKLKLKLFNRDILFASVF